MSVSTISPANRQQTAVPASWTALLKSGQQIKKGPGPSSFTISIDDEKSLNRLLRSDVLTLARSFVNCRFDVSGDIVRAVRELGSHRNSPAGIRSLLAAAEQKLLCWFGSRFQSRERAARDIRFHYDRSSAFYRLFLDTRLVYSSALFLQPEWSLEQAQSAKLHSICQKLDLRPGETFLDIGCGWGALAMLAAGRYGTFASGCTLSRDQLEFARSAVAARRLEQRAAIFEMDYRDLPSRFAPGSIDKISSVGMFEHVGRRRLPEYFRIVHDLLREGGLFLNSGITRPQQTQDDLETYFLQTDVFPGGELAHLSNIVRDAENAGFEIIEVESIRRHYARTCREWVTRLQQNAASCIGIAGEKTWRTWLLYLAASVASFEDGSTNACQILMAKC